MNGNVASLDWVGAVALLGQIAVLIAQFIVNSKKKEN